MQTLNFNKDLWRFLNCARMAPAVKNSTYNLVGLIVDANFIYASDGHRIHRLPVFDDVKIDPGVYEVKAITKSGKYAVDVIISMADNVGNVPDLAKYFDVGDNTLIDSFPIAQDETLSGPIVELYTVTGRLINGVYLADIGTGEWIVKGKLKAFDVPNCQLCVSGLLFKCLDREALILPLRSTRSIFKSSENVEE
jgi:hypothetical protein